MKKRLFFVAVLIISAAFVVLAQGNEVKKVEILTCIDGGRIITVGNVCTSGPGGCLPNPCPPNCPEI